MTFYSENNKKYKGIIHHVKPTTLTELLVGSFQKIFNQYFAANKKVSKFVADILRKSRRE